MTDHFMNFELLAKIALFGLLGGIVAAVVTQSWVPILVAVFGLAYLGRHVYRLSE